MLQHGRHALALLALSLAATAFAEDPLPPDLAALRAKAENGNAIAQYNLGLAFVDGREVPADPVEAYVWLTLASEQGSTAKEVGTLVSSMSDETLAEAKRRLVAVRSSLGIPVPVAKVAAPAPKPTPPTAAEQKPIPEPTGVPPPAEAAVPASVTEPLNSRIKELQDEVAQKTALSQQLSQQLDERGQALLQALAQLSASRTLQDTQYGAKVAELASVRHALDE